ncbi:PrsW family intramembrane metalloprotease [Arthrobacter livingstonensis]|uniref:PrsW family intramembrane metalloprotease n=1 Tax=Arthrobacter livingstonensis TaxID=670078 RepID=A0A2V5L9J2_9MICC|nr:PrsW family intramembrane metalloprotease [Arthrobacter livingstonensis]PYI67422.1 PrsW family intramembrane metalloprotease [Arthrobacter livingstonensis]
MTEPGNWQNQQNQQLPLPRSGAPLQQAHSAQELLSQGPPGAQPAPSHEYWAHPAPAPRRRPLVVTNVILLCVLLAVTLGTLAVFAFAIGVSVFLVCGALALVPLTICVVTLMWIDRWEPEPKTALLFGFCWGAGMAVVTALVVGSWVQPLLTASNASADPDLIGAVIQAPLVEEFCKGAGVLLLFFLRRRTFDGPIDGVVYAGIIAAGFAFTENILYFGQAFNEAGGHPSGLVGIFVMRGLMSPFAHVMFTGMLGACVGYAARHGGTALVLGAWVVGLVPAMLLHGLRNSLTFIHGNFLVLYLVMQVPVFILCFTGIVFLRRAEARLTRQRLSDYVPAGWFSQPEVPMLASGGGRRRALAWSKTFGAGKVMKEFIRLATRLAFTRQRILVDARGAPGSAAASRFAAAQGQELTLLHKAAAARGELLGRHGAAVAAAQHPPLNN